MGVAFFAKNKPTLVRTLVCEVKLGALAYVFLVPSFANKLLQRLALHFLRLHGDATIIGTAVASKSFLFGRERFILFVREKSIALSIWLNNKY